MNAVVMNSQRTLERVELILYLTINRIVRGTEHNSMTSCEPKQTFQCSRHLPKIVHYKAVPARGGSRRDLSKNCLNEINHPPACGAFPCP